MSSNINMLSTAGYDRHLSNANTDDGIEDWTHYVETTNDPGNSLFYVALLICVTSLVGLPIFVRIGRFLLRRITPCARSGSTNNNNKDSPLLDPNHESKHNNSNSNSNSLSFLQRFRNTLLPTLQTILQSGIRWRKRGAHNGENMNRRLIAVKKGVARESALIVSPAPYHHHHHDENNKHQQHPRRFHFSRLLSSSLLSKTIAIIKYDKETRRILRLAIPFTCSSLIGTISSLVLLVIISKTLGTDSTVAYVMVDAIVGVTSSFTGGWVEAISSLASQAYGAENYKLVGQYVQTSCIAYVVSEIPMAIIWANFMGDAILWLGFDESVAVLSGSYVWVVVVMNMISGVNEANLDMLEVVEMEKYANAMSCMSSVTSAGLVAIFAFSMEPSLVQLGLVMIGVEILFLFLNIAIPSKMGWYLPFKEGLFGRVTLFRDSSVVKQLFKTALPLSFGGLLAYAEWEILILFAAFSGPAEVVAWTLLGSVWDVFESTTAAIGDASEVRCAYHLGEVKPALAKLSAYKSMFLAFVMSLIVTTIFLSLSGYIPAWLTHDATIQSMLSEQFPLVALGNITMNMGMVAWAIVGAQGRYHLATSIATACSLLVTIPLGAILTIWLRIDLTGLTFAVVVGYTVTAMLLTMCIQLSDWERISIEIQETVGVEDPSVLNSGDEKADPSGQGHVSATANLEQGYVLARDDSPQEYVSSTENFEQGYISAREDSGQGFVLVTTVLREKCVAIDEKIPTEETPCSDPSKDEEIEQSESSVVSETFEQNDETSESGLNEISPPEISPSVDSSQASQGTHLWGTLYMC